MAPKQPAVFVIVQREGAADSRAFRLPLWGFRALVWGAGALAAALLLGLVWYLPIVRAAARVPGLEREVARLERDNAKVRELAAALDSAEARYAQLRRMVGADVVPDPLALATTLPIAPTIRARTPEPSPPAAGGDGDTAVALRWPLDEPGFVTRGQVSRGGRDEAHPGIDIAVPMGSLVRAAGGGEVEQTGADAEYGLFVLLRHADSLTTMYGHLSRVLVAKGDKLAAGQVIGTSGNSGRSSAPHLHFEVRRNGESVDPLSLVKEGS
ncbi:MAG TPA: M23 family metallopeptidase [Gemmatimonadales bacterium]|nr:M23 family metallopeptidase [Gemmatimonadales bacterium]